MAPLEAVVLPAGAVEAAVGLPGDLGEAAVETLPFPPAVEVAADPVTVAMVEEPVGLNKWNTSDVVVCMEKKRVGTYAMRAVLVHEHDESK